MHICVHVYIKHVSPYPVYSLRLAGLLQTLPRVLRSRLRLSSKPTLSLFSLLFSLTITSMSANKPFGLLVTLLVTVPGAAITYWIRVPSLLCSHCSMRTTSCLCSVMPLGHCRTFAVARTLSPSGTRSLLLCPCWLSSSTLSTMRSSLMHAGQSLTSPTVPTTRSRPCLRLAYVAAWLSF